MAAFDLILRGGALYDGSGAPAARGDLAIRGDRIAAVGRVEGRGAVEVDVGGLAVAPGFVNMMSWAHDALMHDGRGESDLRQGVTLEVMGEGWSMGPLDDRLAAYVEARQTTLRHPITWRTLDGFLRCLTDRGVACNVTSFVGAGLLRALVVGFDDRPPTSVEQDRMCALAADAMRAGAVGVSSALAYAPDCYATVDELTALARVAAAHGGAYASHVRDEGAGLLPALDEFVGIVERAGVRGEVYHLKASGRLDWHRLEAAITLLEAARARGLPITADAYPYAASSSGLDWLMPGWVREGGYEAWFARLAEPSVRRRAIAEMKRDAPDNPWRQLRSADEIVLTRFRRPELRRYAGRTLADVAAERGVDPFAAAIDLVVDDRSRIGAMFFSMSSENVRRKLALPWLALCSDAAALAPRPPFLDDHPHPRAYGSFARFLGHWVRDEGVTSLADAIRRITALPAGVLGLTDRGRLAPGCAADVAVFDPAAIRDVATYAEPHRFAEGMVHVLVNGVFALRGGAVTPARPGRVVRRAGS